MLRREVQQRHSPSGRTESALPTHRTRKLVHLNEFLLDDGDHHQLGNTFSPLQLERLGPVVDLDHLDLPPISGIDQPGTIHHSNPETGRQAAARYHQSGEPDRDRHRYSGRHHRPSLWIEPHGFARIEVNTAVAGMGVARRR